jgi:hypothetical protein
MTIYPVDLQGNACMTGMLRRQSPCIPDSSRFFKYLPILCQRLATAVQERMG